MRLHRQKKHHHRQASNTALEQLHDAIKFNGGASGGKVQKHIGKVERSCCWTCGALDPQNSLDCFKLIIRMPAEVLLTLQASLVDNLLGDHLIFEQIDDEEAEMV
ncbi:uncharacterized protein LOC130140161 isoform X4 [Syzygium oleosum]|uniref:uncharacterized protein LOC130140161 isoform X4 n=1 Tax=Syzygium oleosum TaxID=219896 RepID=UPI0024BBC56D|nr:uncharacterized protein LOC130140161 isoform X4 [Syzygium oleosum]